MYSQNSMRNLGTFIFFLCFALSSTRTLADGAYEYPELQVTPLASDRLAQEAKNDQNAGILQHASLQISALATLASGILHSPKTRTLDDGTLENRSSGMPAYIVGGVWLAVSLALPTLYNPYEAELVKIRAMPAKSKREILARERMAEEAIQGAARTAKRLAWISTVTNFGVNVMLAAQTKSEGLPLGTHITAAVFSFAPLVFPSRWIQVARDQEDYKRRIYGPVTSLSPGAVLSASNSRSAAFLPGVTLRIGF
jgi:hypothetical protein